ncbi:MAG: hypothetical protein HFE59_10960 [Clostridiales bacterium]|nr:hypothetical protein [Clostridiales bacterium]
MTQTKKLSERIILIVYLPPELPEGRYTIRETRAANGYYLDEVPKTVDFKAVKVTEII